MKLSKHFSKSEFKCKCCGLAVVDAELIIVLEKVRERFGTPITITSGYRCDHHNKEVGGATRSKHKLGIAADIVVIGVSPSAVADYIELISTNKYGIGRYNTFTHVDVRQEVARW